MYFEITISVICCLFALLAVLGSNLIISTCSYLLLTLVISVVFYDSGALLLASLVPLFFVGGFVLLFVFLLMFKDIHDKALYRLKFSWRSLFGTILIIILFGVFAYIFQNNSEFLVVSNNLKGRTTEIASTMLTKYIIPFELISITVLGFVLAIVMIKKEQENTH